jgi:hypothetical protein
MKVLNVFLSLAGLLAFSLACGGGGGGGGTGGSTLVTSNSSGGFFSLKMTQASPNAPALSKNYSNTVEVSDLTLTQISVSKDLIIAVKQAKTTDVPEIVLALQGAQPTSGNLSGIFSLGMYGLASGSSKVQALQLQLDFRIDPSAPVVSKQGTLSSGVAYFDDDLPADGSTFSISSGRITWGVNWEGMTNAAGTKILLAHKTKNIFIIGAQQGSYSALSEGTYTAVLMAQGDDSPVSGIATFSVASFESTITVSGERGEQINRLIPKRKVEYSSGNSYMSLKENVVGGGELEQGFIANSEFFVITNAASTQAPYILIGLLP